ncbi:rhodanese-like domain-containing protein [Chryseolinea soli]|uniref:Rhodanese-like domain-containing protein n=2 Tax=Chryseolinea soli TaxID=2321403 RepID=A0A385SZ59_9BACT|nr:rhodanese-like domain-containing protein [Chryseolinea soli]
MNLTTLLILLSLTGCSPDKKEAKTETETAVATPQSRAVNDVLEPADFKQKLAANTGAVLLDVRTPEEVAEGALPGAVNINFNAPDFKEKIAALDKTKPYFVYCKVGGRSGKAATLMNESGFQEVHNLKGGYDAWVGQGLAVEKK